MSTTVFPHGFHWSHDFELQGKVHVVVEGAKSFIGEIVRDLGAIVGIVLLGVVVAVLQLGLAMAVDQVVYVNEHPMFVDNTQYPVYSKDGAHLLSTEEMNLLLASRKYPVRLPLGSGRN